MSLLLPCTECFNIFIRLGQKKNRFLKNISRHLKRMLRMRLLLVYYNYYTILLVYYKMMGHDQKLGLATKVAR